MSYLAEYVAKAVYSLLQGGIEAALAAVASRWESDPVDLGSVQNWQFGHSPTVLERKKAEFPIVSVIPGPSMPQETSDQWVLPSALYEVYVDLFMAEDTEEKVTKKLLRYCEAAMDIFEASEEIPNGGMQAALPAVDPSEVSRQHVEGMNIEYFTQWARVSLVIER